MNTETKERPAYIRFERRAIEDRTASVAAGHYVGKDVDFAIVTPVGTKDEIPKLMSDWLPDLKQKVKEGRLPASHEEFYVRAYEAWKKGEEMPLEGTPIKGWQVISPAQQQNCITANIRTVEDLATANGEALTRIGMGGQELRQKAETWLKAAASLGTVVQINAALTAEIANLKVTVESLAKRNEALAQQLKASTPDKVAA